MTESRSALLRDVLDEISHGLDRCIVSDDGRVVESNDLHSVEVAHLATVTLAEGRDRIAAWCGLREALTWSEVDDDERLVGLLDDLGLTLDDCVFEMVDSPTADDGAQANDAVSEAVELWQAPTPAEPPVLPSSSDEPDVPRATKEQIFEIERLYRERYGKVWPDQRRHWESLTETKAADLIGQEMERTP